MACSTFNPLTLQKYQPDKAEILVRSLAKVGIIATSHVSGILNEWDSLVALLKSEMKIHGNKAPETYRRISKLRKD
ncbi:hypothetical protein [Escherichia coli]|uniref:hypothetical protein n=1 Tax=Escherichia coli TaxID=562 RepID=UPI0007A6013E|nr:hypothetical protein [Escherichia coli]